MNFIKLTVSTSHSGKNTKDILLNLDKVTSIQLLDNSPVPEKPGKWLTIDMDEDSYSVHDEEYAIALFDRLSHILPITHLRKGDFN